MSIYYNKHKIIFVGFFQQKYTFACIRGELSTKIILVDYFGTIIYIY